MQSFELNSGDRDVLLSSGYLEIWMEMPASVVWADCEDGGNPRVWALTTVGGTPEPVRLLLTQDGQEIPEPFDYVSTFHQGGARTFHLFVTP